VPRAPTRIRRPISPIVSPGPHFYPGHSGSAARIVRCKSVIAPETHRLAADGGIPNSELPMLVYHAVGEARDAESCQSLFARNGWTSAWRNGIFSFDHFHSTAHEALGVVTGEATVVLGGPKGLRCDVHAGDVLVLPAGTAHRNDGSSADFLVVGAYPSGTMWDLRRGDPSEYVEVLENLAAVPLPSLDPVHGRGGHLIALWRA
jgi:uncharacterized protein YjlB